MKKYIWISFLFISINNLFAQDFMMQAWYWDYPQYVDGQRFIKSLESEAPALAEAGFTYLWLPPLANSSSGVASIGYDVADYYDLGQYASARWGIRPQLNDFINTCDGLGMNVVADVVYNHRDGGIPEDNPSVEGWIENMTYAKVDAGDQPFPSDRYRVYLPLGGNSGNAAGTYYFKISSASAHPNHFGKGYQLMMWTNTVPANYNAAALTESATNGGGDCAEGNDIYQLAVAMNASVDNGGCGVDEFELSISASDFDPAGDTLWITMRNSGNNLGAMSDHHIYGIWSANASADIQTQLGYQTYTDHNHHPSGRGGMNWENFKPNGEPTGLSNEWDLMYFYYDVDHRVQSTNDTLQEYTRWLWDEVGIRGYRVDAVKHFQPAFMGDMLDYLHDNGIDPGMIVGESFDYSPSVLQGWLNDVEAAMDQDTKDAIDIRIFDFALRNEMKEACDNPNYPVRDLFSRGLVGSVGQSSFNVVTFLNNHDFRENGQPIVNNLDPAYAYLLTNNQIGLPNVFYTDYFTMPGLRGKINGLMEAHKKFIFGASGYDYLNNWGSSYNGTYSSGNIDRMLVYQLRDGLENKDVVVALNFSDESLVLDQQLNMANLVQGDTLTDIFALSNEAFALVNSNNEVHLEVAPHSFGVWIQGDQTQEIISLEDPVSVPNIISNNELKVYPNPFDNYLDLELETKQASQAEIRIYNLLGQEVFNTQIDLKQGEHSLRLNPNISEKGVFIISIETKESSYTQKIIKS